MSTDNPDDKHDKSMIRFPSAPPPVVVQPMPDQESRAGIDQLQQGQQRRSVEALVATEIVTTPGVEEARERETRVKAKLQTYYWLRNQRVNQSMHGALEGVAVGIGWQIVQTLILPSLTGRK